jgi:hypothetical protein
MFTLTITNFNDAHSGDYATYADARNAADNAAAIDGLTVSVARFAKIGADYVSADGSFCDDDGMPWFDFTIRRAP